MLFKLKFSVFLLLMFSFSLVILILLSLSYLMSMNDVSSLYSMFPVLKSAVIFISLFLCLSLLNLMSMVIYSYPVTTTLGFNLSAALTCWISSILIQSSKFMNLSSILPSNSPWYLVPFLCLVEFISISVRPITLCFRLLANMVAGHVLIALICKMSLFWSLGSLFSTLELAVALVQAFVFSMLVSVYLEEAFSH